MQTASNDFWLPVLAFTWHIPVSFRAVYWPVYSQLIISGAEPFKNRFSFVLYSVNVSGRTLQELCVTLWLSGEQGLKCEFILVECLDFKKEKKKGLLLRQHWVTALLHYLCFWELRGKSTLTGKCTGNQRLISL